MIKFLKKINNLEWIWVADLLIISFISVVAIYANVIWQINYTFPPHADYAHHFLELSAMELRINSCTSWLEKLLTFFFWPSSYPPGMYWSAYLSSFCIGRGVMSAMMSQMCFFPLLSASIYFMVRPRYGLVAATSAAVICASSVFLCMGSISYIVDYPSAAFTALCFCLFFNSNLMQRTDKAIALGLSLGLGCLFKPTTFLFVAPALIILFFIKLNQLWIYKGRLLISLAMIALLSIAPVIAAGYVYTWPSCNADLTSFFPVYKIVFILAAMIGAVALFISAFYLWKPNNQHEEAVKLMRNLMYAFACFYFMFFPWASANCSTMFWRSHHLGTQLLNNIVIFGPDVYFHGLAEGLGDFPTLIITMLGVLYSWRSQGNLEERLAVISCLTASLISIFMLSPAVRYLLPAIAVGCYFFTAFFRRIPGGYVLALLLASTMFWLNIMESILYPSYEDSFSITKNYGPINMYTSLFPYPSTADVPFKRGWDFAAQLHNTVQSSNSDPLFVAVLVHNKYPNINAAESFKIGMHTWSNYHSGSIVPVLVDETMGTKQTLRLELHRNLLNMVQSHPLQAEILAQIINNCQHHHYDYVIDVHARELQPFAPEKISYLLRNDKNLPINFNTVITTKEYIATLYSSGEIYLKY
ncbi:MAG: glycosyltransferase family 39 protein [Candidatus Bruticola sp.]